MYNDQEQMIDDEILGKFLDNAVAKAKKRIEVEGRIETEDAIPLMLKSQFNHIAHLETKMVTRDEFNARFASLTSEFNTRFASLSSEFNTRFSVLDGQFGFIKWIIMLGFGLLSAIVALLGCLQAYALFTK